MKAIERQYLGKISAMGCICCELIGYPESPAEIHHPRAGAGMGRKSSNFDAIPLCSAHHRGTSGLSIPSIHASKNDFIKAFGTEDELLEKVLAKL